MMNSFVWVMKKKQESERAEDGMKVLYTAGLALRATMIVMSAAHAAIRDSARGQEYEDTGATRWPSMGSLTRQASRPNN